MDNIPKSTEWEHQYKNERMVAAGVLTPNLALVNSLSVRVYSGFIQLDARSTTANKTIATYEQEFGEIKGVENLL
ncbi:hypothetical protein FQR65_LT16378 [Abscondita terminalis]|nr:hypothetical protein FQR65_LT16378 [Abscondita terminalis]